MKKTAFAMLVLLMSAGFAYADTSCDNCMMKVRDGSPYRVTVTFTDGSEKNVCSIFCASMEKERSGDKGAKLTVVDYLTGEPIDARDAVWVEGSDARAVMSEESRVAFKDNASAKAFVKEHGGRLATFDEVYGNSVKEWKDR
jgi:copper chaperone NosL